MAWSMTNLVARKRMIKLSQKIMAEAPADAQWHYIDAKNMVVGRLASRIAPLLTGKHKPTYLLEHDRGDYVVVTNARHMQLTGEKFRKKTYYWHTGPPAALRARRPRAGAALVEPTSGVRLCSAGGCAGHDDHRRRHGCSRGVVQAGRVG